jgi:hypothetical protein
MALCMWYIASAHSKQTPQFKKILQMFDFSRDTEQDDEQIEAIFSQVPAANKKKGKDK